MKKLVSNKKHKKHCCRCGCNFKKGDIYYIDRIYLGYGYRYTQKYCAKCKYKEEQHRIRLERYKKVCKHPIAKTKYHMYEPGMYEPDYDYCLICGEILD